jgi:hypothetical protein
MFPVPLLPLLRMINTARAHMQDVRNTNARTTMLAPRWLPDAAPIASYPALPRGLAQLVAPPGLGLSLRTVVSAA